MPLEQRKTAADLFAQQLVNKHASFCPWRTACCSEGVLAFRAPSGAEAQRSVVDGYHARAGNLKRVSTGHVCTSGCTRPSSSAAPARAPHPHLAVHVSVVCSLADCDSPCFD